MVTLNLAYTTAINPPDGLGPVLSEAQIWAGLQLKVRDAPAFVSAISSCTVLEDREAADGVVVREIVFASAPDKTIRETCRLFGPSRVDFHQPDGSVVSNIISNGPSGLPTDLFMTYSFSWQHPDVDASDKDRIAQLMQQNKAGSKMAVEKSIEAIRRMVTDGTIKA